MQRKEIQIGMIGANYGAFLHCEAYRRIGSVPFRLKTLCYHSNRERAERLAREYGFLQTTGDYEQMLADPEIDVVDIVAPPLSHAHMIRRALACGKHVICEKPLTGYVAAPDDPRPLGERMPKSDMYAAVLAEMDALRKDVLASGRRFYYAENFVYAPAVQRIAEIVRLKKSRILMMRAFFGMSGSSSPLAGDWAAFGGGCWFRNGVHPLAAILYLKQREAAARGVSIVPLSVTADMGRVTASLTESERRHIAARPIDVEDNGTVVITFSDGSKATLILSDTVLGGSQNTIGVYTNDGAMECKLLATDALQTYFADEDGLDGFSLSEMLPSKLGWNRALVSDDALRGYNGELSACMHALARDEDTDCGFELGYLITKVVYAAYCSAEQGRRIDL